MPFPEAQRVIYDAHPIEEVICQLRFPTILRIEGESPFQFQERIRDSYPLYKPKPAVKLMEGIPKELASFFGKELSLGNTPSGHEFISQDEKWTLSLTKDFLTLQCSKSFLESFPPTVIAALKSQ